MCWTLQSVTRCNADSLCSLTLRGLEGSGQTSTVLPALQTWSPAGADLRLRTVDTHLGSQCPVHPCNTIAGDTWHHLERRLCLLKRVFYPEVNSLHISQLTERYTVFSHLFEAEEMSLQLYVLAHGQVHFPYRSRIRSLCWLYGRNQVQIQILHYFLTLGSSPGHHRPVVSSHNPPLQSHKDPLKQILAGDIHKHLFSNM